MMKIICHKLILGAILQIMPIQLANEDQAGCRKLHLLISLNWNPKILLFHKNLDMPKTVIALETHLLILEVIQASYKEIHL